MGMSKTLLIFDYVKPFIYWSYGIGIYFEKELPLSPFAKVEKFLLFKLVSEKVSRSSFAERYSQVLMGVNCCLVLVYETV